ncbi:hypothetical protein EJ06DRAFT_541876, partial [Trichodelitschia bisporula]
MFEVGRNAEYCKGDSYQSACCSGNRAVAVYGTCGLGSVSHCEKDPKCKAPQDHQFGYSLLKETDNCHMVFDDFQNRPPPLCCDTKAEGTRVESCEWFRDIGP